jgi:hypothetical protein
VTPAGWPGRRSRWPSVAVLNLSLALAMLTSAMLTPAAASARGPDTDGDGLADAFEAHSGGLLDPTRADTDGDGVIDPAEDPDHDGLANHGEQRAGTLPYRRDSDRDGRSDGREDADGDGLSNGDEQDHRAVPTRLRPSLADAFLDLPAERDGCQATTGAAELTVCEYAPEQPERFVVLVGDSHAMMYMPALQPIAAENRWRLVTLVKSACMPVLGVHNSTQDEIDGGSSCRQWRRNALAWLAANPPDAIILAYSDNYELVDAQGRLIAPRRRPQVWADGMRRTLAALPDHSQVLVVGDVPNNSDNPVICLRKHLGNLSACESPREAPSARPIEAAIRDAARDKGARFGTIYDRVCSYDPCPLVQGEILMWRDGSHLTRTIVEQLTPSVREMLAGTIAGPVSRRGPRG